MDIEKMKENQVVGYAVLYGFKTGPAWAIIKKNGSFAVRWPALEEQIIRPADIRKLKHWRRYVPENKVIILKDEEYVFLIKKYEPLIGNHEEIKDLLRAVLASGKLNEYESDCVDHYIETT